MEGNYRARVCPLCLGHVECDLQALPEQEDKSFRVTFTAECAKCGLKLAGNSSRVFNLFLDNIPTKMVQDAFFDKDDKWVYSTANYRGV